MRRMLWWSLLLLSLPVVALADKADVVGVAIKERGNGLFQLDVTIAHKDEGWEHYVDHWEVLDADGKVIATRTLFHPHTGEATFTRSLVGLKLPPSLQEVTVRAHCSVDGFGGKSMTVKVH